jgi:thiamine biosynthesis protein ThiS
VISVTLNGEKRQVPEEIDLENVIDLFSLPHQRVAIELNKTVIRRAEWPHTNLKEGDVLEVVHFVGGG